ncbi:hypothetical protein [Clostridium magnum]|uniref:Uncharacterized protein n=1 Tax=Clostridium magnum DSM 2767 TaxID=1121326 RepID=A0A162UVX7_9CLOT|nr:hypothetical protein [Clostridium magnum]KZL94340.1 hypothetical protein CLMAG_13930 [Clostridium magnum DSM 2767]SHJ54288.1 hypothetical protein SAMN02745944_06128 [Clostridium magnum DSM 2767]
MNLEFKTYQLKEGSRTYEKLVKRAKLHNEFIIVGEDHGYYKAIPSSDDGLKLISALMIDEQAMFIPKDDLELKKDDLPGVEVQELNIPKEYLTIDIIEDIQRLNS